MKSLKILHCSNSGIDQNGIQNLDLIELDAHDNDKIFNVSFMKSLQKLNIKGKCGTDFNLVEINYYGNQKISLFEN